MHQLEFLFTLQSFITLLLCERRRTRTELHFVRTRVGGGGRQEGDPRGYTRRTDGRTDGLGCIRRTFNVQTQLRPALCASVQRSFVRRVFALERSGWRTHGHSGRTQGPNGRTSEEGRKGKKKSALFLSLSLSIAEFCRLASKRTRFVRRRLSAFLAHAIRRRNGLALAEQRIHTELHIANKDFSMDRAGKGKKERQQNSYAWVGTTDRRQKNRLVQS